MWFYLGMGGAFCFILIQLVLLIDFAHSWNEAWVEKMEEGNSRCWYAGMVKPGCSLYLLSSAPTQATPHSQDPGTTLIMSLCCVFTALLSVTAVNYLLSLVSLVMFYVYYTHSDGCTENKVFISINMLLCIAVSVMSVLPQIQVRSLLLSQAHVAFKRRSR